MTKFDNKYDPKVKEENIRKFWEEKEIFKFDKKTSKPIFSIDTPPPTISGKMHIGHAFSYTQTDFIARYKRMKGFEVFYPFGTDDNGLATEKLVQKEKKVDLRKVDRKEAVKIVIDYLEKARPEFIQDWKNLGISCDFENLRYSTIDNYSQKISQKSFIKLYKKGLIERRKGPVMWDRVFQTAIAQAELEDVERKAFLNYVKAKVEETENTFMIYATTRPELCFAVVGMSVEDKGKYVKLKVGNEYWITGETTYKEKFAKFDFEVVESLKGQDLIGERVNIPIAEKVVEISHDVAVKADFGTGIAYFCTYGGQEDIEWAIRHNVEPIEILNIYGKLTNLGGKYEGQLAENARKEIIKELEEKKYLIFKEEKTQVVNVGERSGTEVEFIVSNQWYGKYLDRKEEFFENSQKFNWTPNFMKTRVENWIKGLNWDWGFSRQRHFGIPIPVWYCSKCNKQYLPEEKQLPIDPTQDKCHIKKCDCGNSNFVGETDVFDTWFTSASSPVLASKVLGEDVFKKVFPMSLRPQAHDIINTWLFYTMAKTNMEYETNPFKDVNISGFVLAPDGTKMSKSKGNGVIPQEVVAKYSNDALRFAASSTKLGSDMPYQEKEVQTGLKVVNKIFNANKFASMLLENFSSEDRDFEYSDLNSIDKWIISRLEEVVNNVNAAFDSYDYAKAKSEIDLFFMRDVADNYIEIVKERLWKPELRGEEERKKAQKSLYFVLFNSLKCFAPVLPFITEEVYQSFYKEFEGVESIHLCLFPEFDSSKFEKKDVLLGNLFVDIVAQVRKFKSEKNLSMKAVVENLKIECSSSLKEFVLDSIDDLKAVCGAKNIELIEIDVKDDEMLVDIVLEDN